MKLKKILLSAMSLVLVAAIAVAGTVAYLQDDDSDVNVMTLGNVSIAQHEYERATNTNGSYETKEIDGVTSYVLKDFTQGKALLPSTDPSNHGAGTWDNTTVRMSQVGSYGGMQVFVNPNAQDKFVTVENTGKTDAYVRTLVAVECGSTDGSLVGTSYHSTWTKNVIGVIPVDGNNYYLIEYVYAGGKLSNGSWRHENGILPAGDTSYPNLSQVYISAAATNEDMVKLDGNGNGTLDILVVSQAVQVAGFADAKTALDTAFGVANQINATEWFGGKITNVSDFDDLKNAIKKGGTVVLTDDIALDEMLNIEEGANVRLNMNGKTITASANIDPESAFMWVNEGSSVTIEGNGTFDLGANPGLSFIVPKGEVVIENGTFIREVPAGTDPKAVGGMFVGTKTGSLVIKDGYFDGGYYDKNAELAFNGGFTETADDVAKRGQSGDANVVRVALKNNVSKNLNMSAANVKVYGGTFVGVNPAWGDEGCALPTTPDYLRPWSYYQGTFLDGQQIYDGKIEIPAEYTITQSATADGRPVYTVDYSK